MVGSRIVDAVVVAVVILSCVVLVTGCNGSRDLANASWERTVEPNGADRGGVDTENESGGKKGGHKGHGHRDDNHDHDHSKGY